MAKKMSELFENLGSDFYSIDVDQMNNERFIGIVSSQIFSKRTMSDADLKGLLRRMLDNAEESREVAKKSSALCVAYRDKMKEFEEIK